MAHCVWEVSGCVSCYHDVEAQLQSRRITGILAGWLLIAMFYRWLAYLAMASAVSTCVASSQVLGFAHTKVRCVLVIPICVCFVTCVASSRVAGACDLCCFRSSCRLGVCCRESLLLSGCNEKLCFNVNCHKTHLFFSRLVGFYAQTWAVASAYPVKSEVAVILQSFNFSLISIIPMLYFGKGIPLVLYERLLYTCWQKE